MLLLQTVTVYESVILQEIPEEYSINKHYLLIKDPKCICRPPPSGIT